MSELKMGDVMKKLLYLEEHISCKDYSPDILVGFKHRIVREESELKEQDKEKTLAGAFRIRRRQLARYIFEAEGLKIVPAYSQREM